MLHFIQENAGTIIVGAVVFAIIAAIIIKKVTDKRRGKSDGCGCGCSGCATSDSCSGEKLPPGN